MYLLCRIITVCAGCNQLKPLDPARVFAIPAQSLYSVYARGGVIWYYFFGNDAGQRATVNNERYSAMLSNLDELGVENIWFNGMEQRCILHDPPPKFKRLHFLVASDFHWLARSSDLTVPF